MSERSFDPETTNHHRTARLVLVPWLVRFFNDGPIKGSSPSLPLGNPGALTDETVLAVQHIINRACWKFLAGECGWRKRTAVFPGNRDTHSIRRLWQQGQSAPELTFSESSIELLITIFNATRKESAPPFLPIQQCLGTNGDLLVQHLVYQRLRRTPKVFETGDWTAAPSWLCNPLNALASPDLYRDYEAPRIHWHRLFDADLSPFIPWLGANQAILWHRKETSFQEGDLEEKLEWFEALTNLITEFMATAMDAERIDLTTFLLEWFALHAKQKDTNLIQFQRFTENRSLRERQNLASRWVHLLELITPLEHAAREATTTHPVERSNCQNAFLAAWEDLPFDKTAATLRELIQNLRPSIN